jgi:hypothetical protein
MLDEDSAVLLAIRDVEKKFLDDALVFVRALPPIQSLLRMPLDDVHKDGNLITVPVHGLNLVLDEKQVVLCEVDKRDDCPPGESRQKLPKLSILPPCPKSMPDVGVELLLRSAEELLRRSLLLHKTDPLLWAPLSIHLPGLNILEHLEGDLGCLLNDFKGALGELLIFAEGAGSVDALQFVEWGVWGFGGEEGGVQGFTGFVLGAFELTGGRGLLSCWDRPAEGAGAVAVILPIRIAPSLQAIDAGEEELDLFVVLATAHIAVLELPDKPGE